MSLLAEWWGESLASGPFTRPSEASVKLWLQLAEQAKGLGDSSPQFVAIVDIVTRIVRADVLAALKGSRSLVPWFSALQQCPNMAADILFNWDEYNKLVSGERAVAQLAKLPLLLSDVVMGSQPTIHLLQRMALSRDVDVKYSAVQVMMINEDIYGLAWSQRCLDSLGIDVNSLDKRMQAAADACIVANPSLLSRDAITAHVTGDGTYSAALWRQVFERLDLFPWAIPHHINGHSGELRAMAEQILIDDPVLLEHPHVSHAIRHDGTYSAVLWRKVFERLDLFPWAIPHHINGRNTELQAIAEQVLLDDPTLLEQRNVREAILPDGRYSVTLWRLIFMRHDGFPWALPHHINSRRTRLRACAEQVLIDKPALLDQDSIRRSIRQRQPYSPLLLQLICTRRDLFPWAKVRIVA